MLINEDVSKAIAECRKSNGRTEYSDVITKLNIDSVSLIPFLKKFKQKGYITQTSEDITMTSLGLSAYKDLKPVAKIKKSVYVFSKFTLQRLIDICIGVVIGVIVAFVAYHFGWK